MNGLELTDVCTGCGAVLWIGQAHSCPRRALTPENVTTRLGDLTAGRA
jgi:hypothetical protein